MKTKKADYSKLTKEMLSYGGTVHCITKIVLNDSRMNMCDAIIDSCCTLWAYEFCQQKGDMLHAYEGSQADWEADVRTFTLEKIQKSLNKK